MEHTAEQQRYQQQYQRAYEYDPCNDQSAAYYAYANQQRQYQYYPTQESSSQQYSQFYQEAAPIHPPGVPMDPFARHIQSTVYYPQKPAVQPQQPLVIPVSGSDSAFSTAKFVGNINMIQRGNPPPQMQTAHRGGRRGGRPSRGGSRGHVGNHGLRSDGSALPCNKGRGHSGSRHFASKGVTSAIPNSVLDPSGMPPSASVPGQATLAAQVPAAPPRMAWCELCRVDCNRPEILEQHKNGKRHKRNLQVHEEQQKLNSVITGQQSVQVPNLGSEVVQLEKFEGSEENQRQQETLPFATSNDNKKVTEQQKDIVNKSEASTTDPADSKGKLRDPSEAQARGFKRKKRGGQGGKYMKSNEGPRRPVEPPKPKRRIPFICELCNVKCDSQVVFNSHLAGKKHDANQKKFHADRAVNGETGLQALYPPNVNVPSSSFIPQIQQGLTDPQVVLAELLSYVLCQAQVHGLASPQVSLPATTLAPAQSPLSSLENQYPHQFTQGSIASSEMRRQYSSATKSEASSFVGNNKAESQTSESEKNEMSRQQSFTAKFELPATTGTDVKVENEAFNLESKAVIRPMDNPIFASLEYLATEGKPLLSSTSEKDNGTESKTVSLDAVDESGSNVNLEEPEEDPEEEVEEPEEDPEEEVEDDLEEQNE